MKQRTAQARPQSLREHAQAFWNFYNPDGKPLDFDNIELSEKTINGIMFTTLYESTLTKSQFDRRTSALVTMSGGAIMKKQAQSMLLRAVGRSCFLQKPNKIFEECGGILPNLLHDIDPNVGKDALNQGLIDKAKDVRRKEWLSKVIDNEETLVAEIKSHTSLTAMQILKFVRNLKTIREQTTGISIGSGWKQQSGLPQLRQEIAELLGYQKWSDFYYLFQTIDTVPVLSTITDATQREQLENDLIARIGSARRYTVAGDSFDKLTSLESRARRTTPGPTTNER